MCCAIFTRCVCDLSCTSLHEPLRTHACCAHAGRGDRVQHLLRPAQGAHSRVRAVLCTWQRLTALRLQTFERVVPYYPKERVKRQDVVVRAARAMCSHGFRSRRVCCAQLGEMQRPQLANQEYTIDAVAKRMHNKKCVETMPVLACSSTACTQATLTVCFICSLAVTSRSSSLTASASKCTGTATRRAGRARAHARLRSWADTSMTRLRFTTGRDG